MRFVQIINTTRGATDVQAAEFRGDSRRPLGTSTRRRTTAGLRVSGAARIGHDASGRAAREPAFRRLWGSRASSLSESDTSSALAPARRPLDDSRGQGSSGFDVGRIVQQRQRLQRRVRSGTLRRALLATGSVERPQARLQETFAASAYTDRGDRDRRPGHFAIRVSGSSGTASIRPVDRA